MKEYVKKKKKHSECLEENAQAGSSGYKSNAPLESRRAPLLLHHGLYLLVPRGSY